jgi:hypothetical protein
MRLDAIKVLFSDGKAVGCRFYPLGHPNAQCDATCLAHEHLPPASQPAIEIASAHYASAADAHDAVVALGATGAHLQQAQIAPGTTGLCYQTKFYPRDRGHDWACAFSTSTVVVVVHTAQTDTSFDAVQVATGVASKF